MAESHKTLSTIKAQLFEHELPQSTVSDILELQKELENLSLDLIKIAEGFKALNQLLDAAGSEEMSAETVHMLTLPISEALSQAVNHLSDTIY